ncbi:sulfatase-like hydrolase/transferase [Zobellia galactanivorans]|uniref:sulfatase-like hydrolase/transferase n=1 Tax=Zobellia galactanivorans (strain DSM 12802 / CCUG 47099 / CIP 106680 / NCIMB 13871 / Dsij) TaxID=63186 RepID=UPI0026E33F09|nr:sulfatase-like hydrolase/transferase [Zobellia galactanivorans]MDO6809776.1 sulfatase-like hydrolase/transferase [Zobellia galactanivorans]
MEERRIGAIKILVALIGCGLLISCKTTKEEGPAKKLEQPNIIVLLCDDLGYGDLSSYGHPLIETPNLDALAESGIKLTSFYSTAPVCSPSRIGLLTGRSPNRAGLYDFIVGGNTPREDLKDVVHLRAEEETIPALLKEVGYSTCLVGKWHGSSLFNSEKQPQPDHFGFEHWFATHNNASPSHRNPKNFVRNGSKVGPLEGYSSQLIVDEAIDWLDKKEGDSPFFLEVAFHEPHEPIASPETLVKKYLAFTDIKEEAEFFANVENVDIAVGRLMAYLKEKGLDKNTLVVFTSDNGPETLNRYPKAKRSFGSPGDLRGMKLWTNEAGFRVPCIINWLGKDTYNGTTDAVISALDFLPTFSELAGAGLPQKELDGQSIASFLKTGTIERQKPLVWSFYNALNEHVVAMRKGDWKIMARLKTEEGYLPKILNIHSGNEALVKKAKLSDFVLYHLKEDIGESQEVSKKHPERFERMKTELVQEYGELLDDSHIWARN